MSRRSLAAVLATTLCAGGTALLGAVAPAHADPEPLTWNLTTDMAADPTDNPIPDSYGHAAVWSFESGSGTDASAYQPLTGHAYVCGESDFYVHVRDGSDVPLIGYNGTGGDVSCGTPTSPAGTVVAHPANDADAIVAWTSPVDGTVSFSGTVSDEDPVGGDGIDYAVLSDGGTLAGGYMPNKGSADFASTTDVSVTQGQTIYLQIGRHGDYYYDSTRVALTITDTTATTPAPTPVLTSSSPHRIKQGHSTVATLHGQDFDADTVVSLDDPSGVTLGKPQLVDAQTLRVPVSVDPDAAYAAPRHWQVSEGTSTPSGCAGCQFSIQDVPVTTTVSPGTVARGSDQEVTLTGHGFRSDMVVKASGTGVTVTGVSVTDADDATVSIAVSPSAAKGPRKLTLRVPGQGSSTLAQAFTVG